MKAPSRWGRGLVRSSRLRRALCWTIHLYIRLVYATNRWTVDGAERPRALRDQGRSFILAFWHGRLLMIPMAWQRLAPMHMLISAHRDGRIIADAVTYFGVHSIPGSTRRGGSAAFRAMLKRLDAGGCVGITPDGPRGPATIASSGVVNLARLAGVPIVPLVYATSRRRVLRTWDGFHLPLPFGRGVFLWGEPIEVAPDLDAAGLEDARLVVEHRLNEMTHDADGRVGHPSPVQQHPSAAPRDGEGPIAKRWEGEGSSRRPIQGNPIWRFLFGRHSRERGNPGPQARRLPLDPRLRGGDDPKQSPCRPTLSRLGALTTPSRGAAESFPGPTRKGEP